RLTAASRRDRLAAEHLHETLDRPGGTMFARVARGEAVAASGADGGGHRKVVPASRTDAHLEPTVSLLLEDRGDVRLPGGPKHVDQVVGVARTDARLDQIALGQVRPHQLGLRYLLEPAQRPADQPEVGRSVVLIEHLGEPSMVEIMLAETGGEPERLRGDRFVLEPAGVRNEARVEAERR